MANKQYLGDGVYAEMDQQRDMLVLTTEDGVSVVNSIYLEPEVWDALKTYVARFEKARSETGAEHASVPAPTV